MIIDLKYKEYRPFKKETVGELELLDFFFFFLGGKHTHNSQAKRGNVILIFCISFLKA